MASPLPPVVRLTGVSQRYRNAVALAGIDLEIPAGCMVGLIGPDGVGKSTLLSLAAGARATQQGRVVTLGGDMANGRHRNAVCPRIAYMPQGLGKNLYSTLSVEDNLQFFARLFGHGPAERRRRIDDLTASTGLKPFLTRQAGKLSGGMKQKLGLCCALIHDPELLILDEPTTGVDPLSRAQFWDLIARIRASQPGMSVVVATAYMDEAQRFDWLVAMDDGRVIATGTPDALLQQTGAASLEAAFIALLPEERRRGYTPVTLPPLEEDPTAPVAIEAADLTMRFGPFVAVDRVSFRIRRGEIFGFIGSNGCGKSTTMKMLTGLLPASDGRAWLFGHEVNPRDMETRRRVGYMSQGFSLYSELTVRQNLVLHARLFHVPEPQIPARLEEMVARFGLTAVIDALPEALPLGLRQRLSLAVAMVHKPELLILDEPTSGVDPIARDLFWRLLIELARRDHVTIFISTHFMNEAERCDRVSLMHAGRVLASGTPAEIARSRRADSLEQAFIEYLRAADGSESSNGSAPADGSEFANGSAPADSPEPSSGSAPADGPEPSSGSAPVDSESATMAPDAEAGTAGTAAPVPRRRFSLARMATYTWREALELRHDPLRATLALAGSAVLMFVIGFGISLDVDDLPFAVLDRDQTTLSHAYTLNLSGSRYFVERPPLSDYQDVDRRMRSGELSLAIEIPAGFARDVQRGSHAVIGAWVDGAMPTRAETVRGYVQAMHQSWLADQAVHQLGMALTTPVDIETRFRYNPDVRSLPSMVPAVIPLLLLMLPAMLTALAVVREKELGSIVNLYVTPVTRTEFLLGKQIPYVLLALLNFLLMTLLAVTVFGVPLTGSFATLAVASVLFTVTSTAFGLLASTFTRSQIAAMFFAMLGTMIPSIQFAGLLDPVSSLEGAGRLIGEIYPATHMFVISRGVFNKALGFSDLYGALWPLALAVPVLLGTTVALLRKQGA